MSCAFATYSKRATLPGSASDRTQNIYGRILSLVTYLNFIFAIHLRPSASRHAVPTGVRSEDQFSRCRKPTGPFLNGNSVA